MMNMELLIFGTGAHARKVYHCAVQLNYRVRAFVDENSAAVAPIDGVPVLSVTQALALAKVATDSALFVAIGRDDVRRRLLDRFGTAGFALPALVHPRAYVAPDARLAEGVLVAAGAIVETGATIARGAIVDVGVIVDHDCQIGEFCHLRPGYVCAPGMVVDVAPNLK